jgi:hypothetical protein
MGQASGRFAYVDDPDGTPVDFVETHRIPVFARLGLSLDLTRRDPTRRLPSLLIRALALHRIR